MKSGSLLKRILLFSLTFIVLAFVYYAGYSSGKSLPPEGLSTITLQNAQKYANNYRNSSPAPYDAVVDALVINMQLYNAMTEIVQNSAGTAGFRIYYGIDENSQAVRIVTGIGSTGKDNTNYLVATSASGSGMCPPVCDNPNGTIGQ